MEALLAAGAVIDETDSSGQTPLYVTAQENRCALTTSSRSWTFPADRPKGFSAKRVTWRGRVLWSGRTQRGARAWPGLMRAGDNLYEQY